MNRLKVAFDRCLLFFDGNWAERAGWTLLHSIWQIALIAGVYAVAAVLLRNRSASIRYITGCTALPAMIVLPVITFGFLSPMHLSEASEVAHVDETAVVSSTTETVDFPAQGELPEAVDVAPFESTTEFSNPVLPEQNTSFTPPTLTAALETPQTGFVASIRPWLPWATAIWLAGALLFSLRPIWGWLYVRRLQRKGLSPLPNEVQRVCDKLKQRLGIRQTVEFAQSALVKVPTVVGYLRPMVLLPGSAITGLTPAELELILAHELAHIRRHDYVVNLAQTVIEALLFYHPAMWWVSKQVRNERENCCDDVAVATSGDRATYVRALTQLEQHRAALPAQAATGGSLLMRVRRLLGQPRAEFGYRRASAWLAGVLAIGLLSAILAACGGAFAEAEQPDETVDNISEVENPDEDSLMKKFGPAVGREVAQVIRDANLPFIDEERIKEIEDDFARYVDVHLLTQAYTVAEGLTETQRDSILTAIKQHGAKHLWIDRFKQGNLRSLNLAYLHLPDRLLTLKWKLYFAINQATLTPEKLAALDAQRLWMKAHVKSLPDYRTYTTAVAIEALNERFADPLCCTLGYPMTDDQFDDFQQQLQKYSAENELAHVVSHIVQQSLYARYRDFGEFPIPFDDHVVGYGAGRFVHLNFQSNRPFVASLKSLPDVEASATIADATTGNLLTIPENSRTSDKFRRWVEEKGKGDFGFDDAHGGGLFAARGAKLVKLSVDSWVEADAITNDELRALLEAAEVKQAIPLKQHYQNYLDDNGAPYCYVGVLTKEGRLAVVAVEDFSGRSNVSVRTRVRPRPPAFQVEVDSENEEKSDAAWGKAVDGLQVRARLEQVGQEFQLSFDIRNRGQCSWWVEPEFGGRMVVSTWNANAQRAGLLVPGISQWFYSHDPLTLPTPKGRVLAPGETIWGIRITLDDQWMTSDAPAPGEPNTPAARLVDALLASDETKKRSIQYMLPVFPVDEAEKPTPFEDWTDEGDAVWLASNPLNDGSNGEDEISWGEPVDGVQVRTHSPDVQRDQDQWSVLLKTDLQASKPRILPHYGAPIDEYVIQWDGKWYRTIDRSANVAASVAPSQAQQRDSLHTRIVTKHWIDESTGKPMPKLTPGKHTLRIGFPLIDSPELEGRGPLRAISNPLEIEIEEEKKPTINTFRIQGNHEQSGTIRGKIVGDFGPYFVRRRKGDAAHCFAVATKSLSVSHQFG